MRYRVFKTSLLLSICVLVAACDKGKKPYEEAEALFNKSDYAAAKNKAVEVVQNAPKSKYLAQAKTLYEKVEMIEAIFKTAEDAAQVGDYEKAIKDYNEILALDPKSPKAVSNLRKTKETYDNLKQLADEVMERFRINMKLRATGSIGSRSLAEFDRRYEQASIANVRYVEAACALIYKVSGGRAYLAIRLTEYFAEVEAALNDLLLKANSIGRPGSYEQRLLASDKYNRALSNFLENYGRPETWMEKDTRNMLKRKNGDEWILTEKDCKSMGF